MNCIKTAEPKDPQLWWFDYPLTEFMSLGETLKLCWGEPALKIVKDDNVVLLAPVK